ncbi:MAG: prephenate dehydratase [Lachnospiraceae bacterium]|nr:prephenate dehydratase [Lachnospiraceae bacterium]MDY3729565.1 prephenate dehydratase [Candidatus Choladocola sp.]
MKDLLELREEIDKVDKQIVALFEERMQISEDVAKYKIANGKKVFDKDRERSKLETLKGLADNDFNRHGIEELFQQIMSMSRKLQYQLLTENGAAGRLPFIAVDDIERENIRVVYQGVEGAYSHAAMREYFGKDVNCFHVKKWRDAMEAIAEGAADYAVLPIENSSAGIVADNYDLLVNFENYIVGEQIIKCEHALLGLPGTKLEDIRTVYSHQQALSQCEEYLDQHREWQQIPYDNTARAAKKVAEEKDPSQAAIGSKFAAEYFGLEILAEHVYYNEANSTRFIIVTNQRIFRRDATKISICFEVPHHSGALYNILSHFIYNNLNMNKIESRPIPGRNWEYRFFVDFDGNLNDSAVKNALRGIREEATNMKILGNY